MIRNALPLQLARSRIAEHPCGFELEAANCAASLVLANNVSAYSALVRSPRAVDSHLGKPVAFTLVHAYAKLYLFPRGGRLIPFTT